MKNEEKNIADELLNAFAEDMYELEYEEFADIIDTDSQYQANKHLMENVRYEHTSRKKKRFPKYIAAAIAIIFFLSVTVPTTEASAWKIWKLDFLFSEHSDHVEVKPNNTEQFPQYYVDSVPDGFEISFENVTGSIEFFQYQNDRQEYILFTQVKKEQFVSQIDNENRDIKEELIGDFKVIVSEGNQDCIFEVTTDIVCITVQTNAGYETGKKIIEVLKEY